ncbi:MAG TPA: hypothetical protein VN771_00030 [Candidatus Baltobacteraceae bacterium]|nr:hypothetical protein [Candidatus Baltobacteraceae bacterium]
MWYTAPVATWQDRDPEPAAAGAPRYRLHVVPATRRIGRLFLPGWLAITIGRDIWSWRPLAGPELAHELCHVRQWHRYGWLFVPRYVRASWRAWRAGGDPYRDNSFEVAARRAPADRSGANA